MTVACIEHPKGEYCCFFFIFLGCVARLRLRCSDFLHILYVDFLMRGFLFHDLVCCFGIDLYCWSSEDIVKCCKSSVEETIIIAISLCPFHYYHLSYRHLVLVLDHWYLFPTMILVVGFLNCFELLEEVVPPLLVHLA